MARIEKNKIKTWFVTGASSGIGYRMCEELLNKGYNIIAVARKTPDFQHKNALCLSVDVTKPEQIKVALKSSIEKFGKVDVLVNNAGVSANATCEEETLEHLKEVMEVNFFGSFNTINAFLPHFRENKNGTIINNTSMHGLSYRPYGTAYCSSKHALEGLTSVCKLETKSFCRVMAFECGWFNGTDIVKNVKNIDIKIDGYKNVIYDKKIPDNYENKLKEAVCCLISQIEEELLPRHFLLGKDCISKIENERHILKSSIKNSKRYLNRYCKKNNLFIQKIFSIRNKYDAKCKRKIITLLGIKITVKVGWNNV